ADARTRGREAGRVDGARAAVPVRGPGPRRDRSVRARPRRRCKPCRRHPRPRRRRRAGSPRRPRGHGRPRRGARPGPERSRSRRAARRRRPCLLPRVEPDAGAVRRAATGARGQRHKLTAMRADELKQALKNGVYRGLGEATTGIGAVNGVDGNTVTVPPSAFDEQMAQLAELDYTVVSLDNVIAQYLDHEPLPPRSVLITFDDGYLDNLENAAPILRRHGFPAVL